MKSCKWSTFCLQSLRGIKLLFDLIAASSLIGRLRSLENFAFPSVLQLVGNDWCLFMLKIGSLYGEFLDDCYASLDPQVLASYIWDPEKSSQILDFVKWEFRTITPFLQVLAVKSPVMLVSVVRLVDVWQPKVFLSLINWLWTLLF